MALRRPKKNIFFSSVFMRNMDRLGCENSVMKNYILKAQVLKKL